ncbi:Piso0_004197 [Millerozyma farinosa CBS 7064]|uniref:Piso0_004197 protein n=1 Tax=Pichia sorbitophila (strain ATCC MYA-4447 / BCRC 22081 / CBS 7064 / NBRC 10061 / NRRL Y-12695) TaxID=559304 RepID=G8YAN0_PICSO|nr:Piso0_004197 [Millerozyma farinosa CBS 7064]CCE84644.1 Piso0_004197 [Millerozyma farinosa CBS 7064]
MSNLNTLSNSQKAQIKNAFTLIDGDSRDSLITKDDVVKLYTSLGEKPPSDKTLKAMFSQAGQQNSKGINFTQFSQILATEMSKFNDRESIRKALESFKHEGESDELVVDVERLKEACCSVQLGDIGSGDNRLSRRKFDESVEGFVKEQVDGKKIFLASKWMETYIE